MPTDTIRKTVRAYARARKEHLLASADHFLLVIRDEEPAAVLSSGDLKRLLGVSVQAAAGYGADALALIIEGVFPTVSPNPVTGKPWRRGEAERLWLTRDDAAEGWVSEVQILVLALRTGETAEEAWPFRLRDDVVEWGDAPLPLSGTGLVEALAARIAGPAVDPARVPDPGDGFAGDPVNGPFYGAEYGRVVLDVGTTRVLGHQLEGDGEAYVVVDSDERASRLMREGLPSWQVELVSGTPGVAPDRFTSA